MKDKKYIDLSIKGYRYRVFATVYNSELDRSIDHVLFISKLLNDADLYIPENKKVAVVINYHKPLI